MATDKMHKVQLFIINNPTNRSMESIAMACGVHTNTVWRAFNELNIPPIRRPSDCRG